MSVDLRNVLSDAVGKTLPGTVVFDYPNVEAMAKFLMERVLKLGDAADAGSAKKKKKKLGNNEPCAVVGMA